MIKMANREIERLAYREAGHAVAYLEYNRRIRKVTLFPVGHNVNGCIGYNGRPRDYGEITATVRRRKEEDIVIAFAGALAEMRFKGIATTLHDVFYTLKNLDSLQNTNTSEEFTAFLQLQYIRADDLISDDMLWEVVKVLANKLIKRGMLSGQEAYWTWHNTYGRLYSFPIENRSLPKCS
jgi:hypothetical protein